MEKLFSLDITRYDTETIVTWWRYSKTGKSGCVYQDIPVRSTATYDRLYDLTRKSLVSPTVHARPDHLSISYLF
jgi:hypothetical protein